MGVETEQGSGPTRDVTPRHPPQQLLTLEEEREQVWPSETAPRQSLWMKLWDTPQSVCIGGQTSVKVRSNLPKCSFTPHPGTAWLPWVTPAELQSQVPQGSWVRDPIRPGLLLNKLLQLNNAKDSEKKKKCNFHLRNKILPKTWHHHDLSF
jgi:hypothetical protein